MIERYDYNGKCWWCGSTADSREHKQKKSDFIREFGRKPSISTVLVKNEKDIKIQGPDSKLLKFDKPIICKKCNSEYSQPFDFAWDKVLGYISNEVNLENIQNSIDFRLIDNIDFKLLKRNFLKYLVKHISCRMASNNLKVPLSFLYYLNGKSVFLEGLTIHAFFREDIKVVKKISKEVFNDRYPILYTLPINGSINEDKNWNFLYSGITIGFIEFRYVVDDFFIEKVIRGLNDYFEYSYFPITKIWEPLNIFEDKLEKYNPNHQIPRLDEQAYLERAYNKNFYEWFYIHSQN